jgi:tetratricopeptide (TPR) repeat protein
MPSLRPLAFTASARRLAGPSSAKRFLVLALMISSLFTLAGRVPAAQPKGRRGTLFVYVQKGDVVTTVDGRAVPLDDEGFGRLGLPVGRHTLVVQSNGIDVLTRSFTIVANEEKELIARWKGRPTIPRNAGLSAAAVEGRADVDRRQGKLDEAIRGYTLAIESDERRVWAYINRAWCHLEKQMPEVAIPDLNKAIAIDKTIVEAFEYRGWAWNQQRNYTLAIDEFNKAIKMSGERRAAAYHGRGESYKGLGNDGLAIEDYTTSIKVAGKNPDKWSYVNRGDCYKNQRQWDKAIDDCSTAIKIDDTLTRAYVIRAESYAQKGDIERAAADRKKAESLESKSNP